MYNAFKVMIIILIMIMLIIMIILINNNISSNNNNINNDNDNFVSAPLYHSPTLLLLSFARFFRNGRFEHVTMPTTNVAI